MSDLQEFDVVAAIGPADELIIREVLKTGVELPDLHRAVAFARGPARIDGKLCDKLPPRMQRIVDLVAVALDRNSARPSGKGAAGKVDDRAA